MEINLSLGFISYLASGLIYLFLLAIYFVGSQQGRISKPFVLLLSATLVWSGLLTLSQIGASVAFELVSIAELMRYFTWFFILHSAAGYYLGERTDFGLTNPLTPRAVGLVFVLALFSLVSKRLWIDAWGEDGALLLQVGWLLVFAVLGLLLVEQVVRNTTAEVRGAISLLCISAGAVFVYDLFVFSNALLTRSIDFELWSARGIVNVLVVPTLVLAAVRNPTMAPALHISRKFVFHTTSLIGAGLYLAAMAAIGFYVERSSGEWGKLAQTSFFFGAILLLAVLFLSPRFKAQLRRYLAYSFRSKYDYREEWNRFSRTLLSPDPEISIFQRSIQAIGQIMDSPGGTLWIQEHEQFDCRASWRCEPKSTRPLKFDSPLPQRLRNRRDPVVASRLLGDAAAGDDSLAEWIAANDAWLVLPLWANDKLFGFVCLNPPMIEKDLDLEDIDLLETVAHHVSLALFLQQADAELQQAQRFKAMNQMTAFLVHDLKTVFSQLSLLVENAPQHRDKPEFIDDMIDTVQHTRQKMERLLQQLREPEVSVESRRIELLPVIEEIVDSYRNLSTRLSLTAELEGRPTVRSDRSQLVAAIRHIVQNGVDSAGREGQVDVAARALNRHSVEISIADDGEGMSAEFINNALFKPFESTKGVSGMGVGVYQSREYIRSMGGEMEVDSEVGAGTRFTIRLPVENG